MIGLIKLVIITIRRPKALRSPKVLEEICNQVAKVSLERASVKGWGKWDNQSAQPNSGRTMVVRAMATRGRL